MARHLFDVGINVGSPAASVTIYTDAACTTVADIQTPAGAAISGAVIAVANNRRVTFLGPNNVRTVYTKPSTDTTIKVTLTSLDAGDATTDEEIDASSTTASAAYALSSLGYAPSLRIPARPAQSVLLDMGTAGHGATTNGSTGTDLNDTTNYVRGTQAAKVVTSGAGGIGAYVRKVGLSLNLTDKRLLASIMIDDWTHVASVRVILYTDASNFRLINLWENSANTKPAAGGEWAILTADQSSTASTTGTLNLASITEIRIVVTDDATGNPVTWRMNHLAAFGKSTPYPQGCVIFTTDDNYAAQHTILRPALDKYGFGATAFTILDLIGAGGSASLKQLQDAQSYSGWDIAGHAATLAAHNAVGGYSSLSDTDLDTELRTLKAGLLNGFGRGADHFAYPQGLFDARVEAAVRRYFATARCVGSALRETLPPGNRTRMRSVVLNNTSSLTVGGQLALQTIVDLAYTNASTVIFTVHDIKTTPTLGTEAATSVVTGLVDYVATKGIPVRTLDDFMASA